jgi:hypothetical protein
MTKILPRYGVGGELDDWEVQEIKAEIDPTNQEPLRMPEIALLARVLEQAKCDLIWPEQLGGNRYDKKNALFHRWNIRRQTRAWFDNNQIDPLSFRWICEYLVPDNPTAFMAIRDRVYLQAAKEIRVLEEAERKREVKKKLGRSRKKNLVAT